MRHVQERTIRALSRNVLRWCVSFTRRTLYPFLVLSSWSSVVLHSRHAQTYVSSVSFPLSFPISLDLPLATPPNTSGTLTRYYALPSDLAHPIPESMSFEDGALIEPLAVGVHSVSTLAKFKAGDTVVVTGAGPVGLLAMATAKGKPDLRPLFNDCVADCVSLFLLALGASKVIAVDINAERLAFAKSYAATDTFLPSAPEPNEKRIDFSRRSAKELISALGLQERGFGAVNVVIEASGAEACIQMG